ncbi:MAG: hypothetical protein NVS9B7_02290 [Flavisolibacter sp.]
MAGILYGWIGVYYGNMAQMVDTWAYHYQSLRELELLKSHPINFFTSIFQNSYSNGYLKIFSSENSWWNDLKDNLFIKVLALLDFFSFGNYYINVIFYSFLSLFGPVALYKVMQDTFPNKKIAVLLGTFLLPSFLYWTSGLHKDGLIFDGITLIVYQCYFGLKEKKFSIRRLAYISAGFIILLALRNFLIVLLVPALFAWVLSNKLKYRPALIYFLTGLLMVTVFFSSKLIHPHSGNFPDVVVERQEDFIKLRGGGSAIEVRKLEPNFYSFLINAPQAFALSTLRPYPSDVNHLLSLAAAMEVCFFMLLFFIFLGWRKNKVPLSPFLLFCLFFSFTVLMMIGYGVNILGAIVRYRSIVLPFIIIPLIAIIDWQKIKMVVFGNIDFKTNA